MFYAQSTSAVIIIRADWNEEQGEGELAEERKEGGRRGGGK